MDKCILVDMDGTLSDASHRKHFVINKPKNWKAFNLGAQYDPPIHHIVWLVKQFNALEVPIVILTARPVEMKEMTEKWLKDHGIQYDAIFMRHKNDFRVDYEVKKDLLDEVKKVGFEPIMALDDREQVSKMYRENNVPCLLCAEPAFDDE